MHKIELNKEEVDKLIEDIFLFKKEKCDNLSLIEVLIEYAHKKNFTLPELGDMLSDHDCFKSIFKRQLIKDGYIREKEVGETIKEEEW